MVPYKTPARVDTTGFYYLLIYNFTMLAKFKEIIFFAIAENKYSILKSTVKPIEHLTTATFGILRGKYAFKFSFLYMANTIHERKREIKPKYIAWLDHKRRPIHFVPITERDTVNTKHRSIMYDGVIFEKK